MRFYLAFGAEDAAALLWPTELADRLASADHEDVRNMAIELLPDSGAQYVPRPDRDIISDPLSAQRQSLLTPVCERRKQKSFTTFTGKLIRWR